MNRRVKYFDIAKGIGIICVILGHMSIKPIDRFVFTFHMPLFFLISGYFMKEMDNRKFILKKAKQLLMPYIFTCLCIIMLSTLQQDSYNNVLYQLRKWIVASIYGSGARTDFFIFNLQPIGAIWFLLALLISMSIVNMIVKYKYSSAWIVVFFVVGYYSAKYTWLPFSIQAGFTASLFVYIGFRAKEKEILNRKAKIDQLIIMFIIWGIAIYEKGLLCMVNNTYPKGILDIIGSISATYIIIVVSKIIETKFRLITNILSFYGENSLIILCFHLIELNTFNWGLIYAFWSDIGLPFANIAILTLKFIWVTLGVVLVHKILILSNIFSVRIKEKVTT